MSARRQKPKDLAASAAATGSARSVEAPTKGPTRRRPGFYVAAVLFPFLLLALIEGVLHLAGYGYPTSFFLRANQHGQQVFIENRQFGWRFFPSRVARTPEPLSLARNKPMTTIRIFVFGESAALGDPEPAYGFARQLECMLQARHPDRTFEVVNVAMTAINSHVVREIASDCADKQGDVWLIYAGNNEVVGPFGAGTVFGKQAPPVSAVRLGLWLKKTRIGQFLSSLGTHQSQAVRWEGMEMFLQQQVTRDDPRLARVYQNFEANLDHIVRTGQRAGARVVLCTVSVNLKDCPPFASTHTRNLAPTQEQELRTLMQQGQENALKGNVLEALTNFLTATHLDPEYAEALFQLGSCELKAGTNAAALEHFAGACELDTLRFRADQKLTQVVTQTAQRTGAALVDARTELPKRAGVHFPDDTLFYDHVHLNFHGNYLLASVLLPAAERELFGAGKAANLPEISEYQVASRLAWTDLDRQRVYEEMRLRLQQPPFLNQSNFKARDNAWAHALASLKPVVSNCLAVYAEATARRTNDWVLHEHYARASDAAGDPVAATREWREVARLMPQEPEPWFQLANLAYNQKDYIEAQRLFRQVLTINPGSTEALNGLGLIASSQGQSSQARALFNQALAIDPHFTSARVNLAVLLASAGDKGAAMEQYRQVLSWDTNNVAARINLAQMLANEGKPDEAIELYQQAVRIKPEDAVAQYNLGNALSARQQHAEALQHYSAAVNARPDFAEARYNLGLELARAGRINEALSNFSEAVRLTPDFADARFNYGIALAKEKQYAAAVEQFKETLRLQPQHAAAASALQKATQLRDQQR